MEHGTYQNGRVTLKFVEQLNNCQLSKELRLSVPSRRGAGEAGKNYRTPAVCKRFRHVRKMAKSVYYLRHASLSVRMEQLGSHWTDFHESLYLYIF
jgi:hypothetical protein